MTLFLWTIAITAVVFANFAVFGLMTRTYNRHLNKKGRP